MNINRTQTFTFSREGVDVRYRSIEGCGAKSHECRIIDIQNFICVAEEEEEKNKKKQGILRQKDSCY